MLTLLLGIMIFILFTLIGIVIFSLLKIDKDELLNTYFILLAPILGALVMVCFGNTFIDFSIEVYWLSFFDNTYLLYN